MSLGEPSLPRVPSRGSTGAASNARRFPPTHAEGVSLRRWCGTAFGGPGSAFEPAPHRAARAGAWRRKAAPGRGHHNLADRPFGSGKIAQNLPPAGFSNCVERVRSGARSCHDRTLHSHIGICQGPSQNKLKSAAVAGHGIAWLAFDHRSDWMHAGVVDQVWSRRRRLRGSRCSHNGESGSAAPVPRKA